MKFEFGAKDIFGPLDGMTCDEVIQSMNLPYFDQANFNNDLNSGRSPSKENPEMELLNVVMWPLIGSGLLFCCLFGTLERLLEKQNEHHHHE